MSIEKSNYIIENRTRNLSACSKVPGPTTLPPAPDVCVESVEVHSQEAELRLEFRHNMSRLILGVPL
jgi:hypothetical protein